MTAVLVPACDDGAPADVAVDVVEQGRIVGPQLAVEDDVVYFSGNVDGGQALYRVSATGGTRVELWSGDVGSIGANIDVDAGRVFWDGGNRDGIFSVSTEGGLRDNVALLEQLALSDLVVREGTVYATTIAAVLTTPFDGGEPATLFVNKEPRTLAAHGDSVYLTTAGQGVSTSLLKIGPGPSAEIINEGFLETRGLAIGDQAAYIGGEDNIIRVPLDGSERRDLPIERGEVTHLVWAPENIYAIMDTGADEVLVRVPLDGSPSEVLVAGLSMVRAFVSDGERLYLTHFGGDRSDGSEILRIELSGGL